MGRRLDVYLRGGEIADVLLDGTSLWPSWFKIEWKENGQRSAKIRGERLSTNFGDEIVIHQADRATSGARPAARPRRSTGPRPVDHAETAEAPDATTDRVPLVPELTE